MNHSYKIISDTSEVYELIGYCKDTGYAFIDYETDARKPMDPKFKPTILSVSFQPGSTWVIPLGHKDSVFRKTWKKVFKIFAQEVLENPAIIKLAWNAIFERQVTMGLGYKLRGTVMDPMMAKYLLDEVPPNDLKSQVDYLLPEYAGYDLPGQPGKKALDEAKINFWENVPLDTLCEYGAIDTHAGFMLFLHYEKRLMEVGLYHYLRNFYGPLSLVLSETVYEGVITDPIYLQEQVKLFQDKLDDLEEEIRDIPLVKSFSSAIIEKRVNDYIEELEDEIDSGDLTDAQIRNRESKISKLELGEPSTNKEMKLFEPLNFNSNKQMCELLYESDFGFEFDIPEYTEANNPSVGESALKALRKDDDTGFIQLLLNHRELSKMFTTYIKGIYEKHLTPWGRIHPGYLMHGTVSGRLSSRGPSFQTMPRVTTSSEIKRQFVAPEDYFFVESDGCIPGDVRISTSRGLIPMSEVKKGDFVIIDEGVHPILNHWSTGVKPVFEITTSTGRKVKATANHPFKTERGWLRLDELDVGDTLVIDRSYFGDTPIDPDEAYIAGLFYGDGFYSQNQGANRQRDSYSLSFSLGLDREELIPELKKVFSEYHIQTSRPIPKAVRITNKGLHKNWSKKYPKSGSHGMRVPETIWRSSVDSKLNFLGGLIDSDGSVRSGRVNYGSRSERFIDDLLILAQSVGVYGIKSEKLSGGFEAGKKPSFHWIVYSKSSLSRLCGFSRLNRKNSLIEYMAKNKKEDKCRTEMVPMPVYSNLIMNTKKQCPSKPTGVTLRNSNRVGRLTRKAILDNIFPYVDHGMRYKWFKLLSFNYETIVSIEYMGLDKVYDIEVQGAHAFVANGVIVHNSQMELRVVAEISKDKNMLETFHQGKNIHVSTAARITGQDYDKINKLRKDETSPEHEWAVKEHKKAKVLNFTILYGAGPPTVSEFLTDATGVYHSLDDAAEMIEKWFEAYPGVKKWIKHTHRFSQEHGYVQSPFGRKRRFPVLLDKQNKKLKPWLWNEALRQGPNAVIQGAASDITQYINIRIQQERFKGNLPKYLRLVSTVHDSLEYYVHKNDMGWVMPKIINIAHDMEGLKKYMGWELNNVEMKFSAEFGITWGKMHEFDLKKFPEGFDFAQFYRKEWDEYNKESFPHIMR